MAQPNAGALDLTLVLWDEELTQVVGPLEQNVRLMSVLYPVTAALSVLIAIGVSVLLLFQSAREMAALRAWLHQAAGDRDVQLPAGAAVSPGNPPGPCGAGGSAGAEWRACGRVRPCCAPGCTSWGATIGAMVTSTGLGRRKPMELLQIKE